jgi:hypothetical protein
LTLVFGFVAAAAFALISVERLHVRHVRAEAQAAIDYALVDAVLTNTPPERVIQQALEERVPGRLNALEVLPGDLGTATAVAEVTLPSAWPQIRPAGYKQVLYSNVSISPPSYQGSPPSYQGG